MIKIEELLEQKTEFFQNPFGSNFAYSIDRQNQITEYSIDTEDDENDQPIIHLTQIKKLGFIPKTRSQAKELVKNKLYKTEINHSNGPIKKITLSEKNNLPIGQATIFIHQ